MNCRNCNSIINQGESFCRVCGTQINNEPQSNNYSVFPSWNIELNQQNNLTNQNNEAQTNSNQNQFNQYNNINQNNYNNTELTTQNQNNENQVINQNISLHNQTNYSQNNNQQINENNNLQNIQPSKPQTVFNTNKSQNILNDEIYNDDMLIDAYIGKRADKLKKGGFSWCTFFGGIIYAFYRKMWGFGIVFFIINLIVIILSKIIPFLPLKSTTGTIVELIAAKIFKENYIIHVQNQIEKIKQKNPDKTQEELLQICRKKGGTTIVPIIIVLIISLIYITPSIIGIIEISKKAKEEYKDIYENSNMKNKNIKVNDLNVVIPTNFIEFSNKENLYSSRYSNKNTSCIVIIKSIYNNNLAINYLEDKLPESSNTNISEIIEKNINNNKWITASEESKKIYTDQTTTTYYYVISNNNNIYDVEFIILEDNESKTCYNHHLDIINSVNIK